MRQFLLGAAVSLAVNVITVLGWSELGMWPTSIGNVVIALVVIGFFGLEDKWAFPAGYWTVEVVGVVFWMLGIGALINLS